jgi:queuosine precursor transporter
MQKPIGYRHFHAVAMIFVTSLIVADTIAVKIISIGDFTLPAAIIVFPISYIFSDILTEVYGFEKTRTVIWWGFFCLTGMSLFYWVATLLPAASFWNDQEPFKRLFGLVPRIAMSSFVAYLVGEFLNSMVMSRIKVLMAGRHLWFRAVASTVVGQGADSVVFYTAAFAGIYPPTTLLKIGLSAFILKCAYEVIALPITYMIVAWLKKTENEDVYDNNVKYTPFKM